MHREDNSKYLLYIEPPLKKKLREPINDELTEMMEMALTKAKQGAAHYHRLEDKGDGFDWTDNNGQISRVPSFTEGNYFRGWHQTECGERSSNFDYLLENGMITNSLAPFYLRWYRYSIPESEMNKVKQLIEFYNDLLIDERKEVEFF
jgi:hypothetical protein